jgi:hypothetical protein
VRSRAQTSPSRPILPKWFIGNQQTDLVESQ